METTKEAIHKTAQSELVINRVFDASREKVFRAWTDPTYVKQWWGPKDYTAPFAKIDLRVGGEYLFCMRSPEDKDFWSKGVYREIVKNERLVATDSFADEIGNMVPASQYGMPGNWPDECLVTVTLKDVDGKTKLTLQHAGIPEGEMKELTAAGWNESFDKLAEVLK